MSHNRGRLILAGALVVSGALAGAALACGRRAAAPTAASVARRAEQPVPAGTAAPPETPLDPGPGIAPAQAALIVPLAPAEVTAVVADGSVTVAWPGTGDDSARYEVYRRFADGDAWQPVGTAGAIGESLPSYTFVDTSAAAGAVVVYGVVAVNQFGSRSLLVESPPVGVP